MRTDGRQAQSAVDGFLRGLSMVMGIKNQNRSQDRQDKYLGLAQKQDERQGETHEQTLQHRDNAETRAGERHGWAGETHEQSLGLRESREQREKDEHKTKKEEREETERRRKAREWSAAIANDLKERGKVTMPTLKGWAEAMDVDLRDFLKPEFKESINHLEGVMQGQGKWRDRRTISAMNTVFGPMVKRNLEEESGDGTKIKDKEIIDVYPGPKGNSLIFRLSVTGEGKDGKPVKYDAPMTKGRSANGDDSEILTVPIDNFIKHIKGRKVLDAAIRMGAVDSEDFENDLLAQYSDRTALTSGGKLPHAQLGIPSNNMGVAVTTAQWLMEDNPNLGREEALKIAQRKDPMEFAQKYAESKLKAQEAAYLAPGDEGYQDYETLVRQGVQIYKRLNSEASGGQQGVPQDGRPGIPQDGRAPSRDADAQGGMQPDPADVQVGMVAIMEDGSAWTKTEDGALKRVK